MKPTVTQTGAANPIGMDKAELAVLKAANQETRPDASVYFSPSNTARYAIQNMYEWSVMNAEDYLHFWVLHTQDEMANGYMSSLSHQMEPKGIEFQDNFWKDKTLKMFRNCQQDWVIRFGSGWTTHLDLTVPDAESHLLYSMALGYILKWRVKPELVGSLHFKRRGQTLRNGVYHFYLLECHYADGFSRCYGYSTEYEIEFYDGNIVRVDAGDVQSLEITEPERELAQEVSITPSYDDGPSRG